MDSCTPFPIRDNVRLLVAVVWLQVRASARALTRNEIRESLAGSPATSISQQPDQVKLSHCLLGDRRRILIEFMPSVEPGDEENARLPYT